MPPGLSSKEQEIWKRAHPQGYGINPPPFEEGYAPPDPPSRGTARPGSRYDLANANRPSVAPVYGKAISRWAPVVEPLAEQYGVDPDFVYRVMRQESGGNPGARSPVGAIGLMQLMPDTARGLGVNPLDPHQNIEGGIKYLAQHLKTFHGREDLAAAAYNAGPGAVHKFGGVPPYKETQNYVKATARHGGAPGARRAADPYADLDAFLRSEGY